MSFIQRLCSKKALDSSLRWSDGIAGIVSSATSLTNRLSQTSSQGWVKVSNQKYQLTLDNGKRYEVTNHTSRVSVERMGARRGGLDGIKTFFATIFGTTTRGRVQTILERNPSLFQNAALPAGRQESLNQDASVSASGDKKTSLLNDNSPISYGTSDADGSAQSLAHAVTTTAVSENPTSSSHNNAQADSRSISDGEKIRAARTIQKAFRNYKIRKSAAETIQKTFRDFKVRKSNANTEKNTNAYGRFMMVNNAHKDHRGKPLVYYFDKADISPPMRRPQESVYIHQGETTGRSKVLEAKDEKFVELSSADFVSFDSNKEKRQAIAKHLAPYRSCCPTVQLDDNTIIARSGGTQLRTLLKHKGQQPELKRFKQACTDLSNMLEDGIIPLDIKTENMAIPYDQDKGQLVGNARFIDTEDTIVPDINDTPSDYNLTPEMTSQELMKGIKAGSLDMAKRNAVYAMLLVLTEATSPELREQPQITGTEEIREWDEGLQRDFVRDEKVPFETSRVTPSNHQKYSSWVKQHIKTEYQSVVSQFLTNPAKNPIPDKLAEAINWES